MPQRDPASDPAVTLAIRTGNAAAFSRAILPYVSRTFAIGIRILRGTLGHAVLDAYLLCRIADTIEDAPAVDVAEKAELFDVFIAALDDRDARSKLITEVQGLTGESAHLLLIRHALLVFSHYDELPDATRAIIAKWVVEMASGMRKFVLLYPGGIRIGTLAEYGEYCYYVAGTVGYMLTDLWQEHSVFVGARRYDALRERSGAFGEGLQSVNILKDVMVDAREENSIYIPEELLQEAGSSHLFLLDGRNVDGSRGALKELVRHTWGELDTACGYLRLLPRRAITIRMFCLLPLLLAYATLREISANDALLLSSGSVRISRREVRSILAAAWLIGGSNRGVDWLVERVRREPFELFG